MCFLYYFKAALKKADIQFKHNNVLCNEDGYSWTYGEITPLFIKWMTSQAYNNNDVLLFPLQIWKKTLQNKVFWIVQS